MNLGNLKSLAYRSVPQFKQSDANDTITELILNMGAQDVALRTQCLRTNQKFTVTADTQSYNLTSFLTRYLVPTEAGLFWNAGDGTTTNWKQLDAKTIEYWDKEMPNWRDIDSGTPSEYAIDGDVLYLKSTPDTTLASGLWMYFAQAPAEMTDDDHYPFGGGTEIHRLKILSECILRYFDWQANSIINKQALQPQKETEYLRSIENKKELLDARLDISNSSEVRLRGRYIT